MNIKEQIKAATSGDLEKAARLYAIPHYMKDIDVNHIEEYPYDTGLEAAFIAGAKWQKEQMLKGAVECELVCLKDRLLAVLPTKEFRWTVGDKVKIIIVKED